MTKAAFPCRRSLARSHIFPAPVEYEKTSIMIDQHLYDQFRNSYPHLKSVTGQEIKQDNGVLYQFYVESPDLRPGNGPRIFHHGKKTDHVIVLTHGLSDSPRYMADVGQRFYEAGLNVILTLLPGHGLNDPDDAFEDKDLDTYWRQTIDRAVALAASFGDVISLGGFSTGGALSYNRILRELHEGKQQVKGGLFLFSAAIELVPLGEFMVNIAPAILLKRMDGTLKGIGPDPYKYPVLPKFGAKELDDIIDENDRLSKGKILDQPVFAAHCLRDDTADVQGVLHLLKNHAKTSSAFIIGEEIKRQKLKDPDEKDQQTEWVNVAHATLPVGEPIVLRDGLGEIGPNPQFDLMMNAVLDFFNRCVRVA
jgi:pimeloyl-ACP methyl ester carboxylesterase